MRGPWRKPQAFAVALVLAALAIVGCTTGSNFVRPSDGAFVLGRTTHEQIVKALGKPASTGEALRNGKKIDVIRYAYSSVEEGTGPDVVPTRVQVYFFYDNVLIARSFSSTFEEDSSSFDESKAKRFTKGTTTRAEVINALGRPSGEYIWPYVRKDSGVVIGYHHNVTSIVNYKVERYYKQLVIYFDDADRVRDIKFSYVRKTDD